MSAPQWREDDAVAVKAEPRSTHRTSHSSMAPPAAASATFASLHVIELLAPLYDAIPHGDSDDDVAVYAVTLRRTADDWLQIMFPELSRPGKMLAMDVACVNQHAGGCRCDFVRLLRSVLTLSEKHVLRVTAKYVISSVETAVAEGQEEEGGRARKTATLQLFLALHERVTKASAANLGEFDLVTSHLQSGLRSFKAKHDGDRLAEAVQTAKQSKCHVVGCELHPLEGDGTQQPDARFTLDEVFQRLTTQVEVDQMAVRDDETYVARMKRAKRKVLLTDLPIPALHTFIRMLGARELAAVSAVCTTFQHLAYEVVPGLKLLLYSHQRRGLRWLLYREGSTREELKRMPHPFVFPSISLASDANPQDEDEHADVIDLIDGKLVKRSIMSRAFDFRGGLFCDEPGLGKTITMLALILRTKGQRSDTRSFGASSLSSEPRTGISLRSSGSRGRVLNPKKLAPSATTLIVVPNPLIDHWKFQIDSHLTDGVLKVYVDDLEFKSTLPSPEELATYDVVITSFGRLTHEWKFRRPTSALEERVPDRLGFEDGPRRFIDGFINQGTSSLLLVHWVRIIVDEGHKLGGTNPTYHMKMARLFHADKRWVMTGTPTPNTLQSADLRHMHGLLVFLRDRPFGEADGKEWNKAIARPFEQNERAGYVRLLHLLNRIMMRHTKESVRTLIPTPIRHTVFVDPTPTEYAAYNGVAAAVRGNLVITNLDPHTPGKDHLDSLLNPIHRKYAMQVMTNLRAATCGGSQISAELDRDSFVETLNLLRQHGADPDRIAEISQFMRKAATIDFLSLCTLCGRHLQLLMLVPCGHMACADCVESRVKTIGPSCGICNASYDREVFQMLQPGFNFKQVGEEWEYDNTPEVVGAPNGAGQQNGNGNGRGRGRGRGGRPARGRIGSSIPVREGTGTRQRIIPIDLRRFAAVNASKAFYVASRITELRKEFEQAQVTARQDGTYGHSAQRPKVVKAIIFSQFKEHIWRTKVALAQQGILCADFLTGMNMTAAFRMQNLLKFRLDPKCNVLLLTDVGSHGLDLSFVTHIFLMDEIWDKSLEKQVISRAHRMGAQHSVVVEQLLMRGSVEQTLHEMNQRNGRLSGEQEKPEEETRAGEHDDDEDDDYIPQRQMHQSGSRAMKAFFASENKHKRQKQRNGASASQDSHSKSSVQHRQLQRLMESLRLMDEANVAEFGFVKFKVTDDQGELVRAASLRLANPGKPPGSGDTDSANGAQPQRTTNSNPPTQTASTASQPRPVPPQAQSAPSSARPNGKPSSHAKSPTPTKSTTSVLKSQNGKQKAKKTVRVKVETPSPATRKQVRRDKARQDIIDLTSDGDSGDDRSPHSRPHAPIYRTTSSSEEWDSSISNNDSETDDEWTPVKREPKQTSAPAKSFTGKGKGKLKRSRVVWDDDDE